MFPEEACSVLEPGFHQKPNQFKIQPEVKASPATHGPCENCAEFVINAWLTYPNDTHSPNVSSIVFILLGAF